MTKNPTEKACPSLILQLHKFTFIQVLLFCCSIVFLQAQHLPPVTVYEPNDYAGGHQNWMLDESENSEIIAANNQGLLLFNGAQWRLFLTQEGNILRSVKKIGDRIYAGRYKDFGYWEKLPNGVYEYYSIVEKAKITNIGDENFWNILEVDNSIFFQSHQQLYVYSLESEEVSLISPPNGIRKLFKLGGFVIYHSEGLGLFKIEGNKSVPYYNEKEIANASIVNIFMTNEGTKILTKENGFYLFRNGKFEKWKIPAAAVLDKVEIFSGIQLKNGDFALGTISAGLYILDEKGQIKYHINRTNGLSNNTVLSLLEDQKSNIWLGLDNGINCINMKSPFMEYIDSKGILGTVYASSIFEDKLYLGTNQGLFWKSLNTKAGEFKQVKNTGGQVWTLVVNDNRLFCGHDKGTLIVDGEEAKSITELKGTWKMLTVPERPELMIQGNYTGLNVLRKVGAKWNFSHPIEGFIGSTIQILFFKKHLYYNNSTDGLYRLYFDEGYHKLLKKEKIKGTVDPYNSSMVTFNGQLYYTSADGLFTLDIESDSLVKKQELSVFLEENVALPGKLLVDATDRMWLFAPNSIMCFKIKPNKELEISEIQVDKKLLKTRAGYENITFLQDDVHLMGLTDGYLFIDLSQLESWENKNEVIINSVSVRSTGERESLVDLDKKASFLSEENNLTFNYSIPGAFKYQIVKYQYQLEGFHEQWSDWSDQSTVRFQNLRSGNYIFHARARVGKQIGEQVASFAFSIKPPWYYSKLALACYACLLLIIGFMVNKLYARYFQEQQDKLIEKSQQELEYVQLKNDQILTQVKNEQLMAKMDLKNKELAATTMNLIQKNEFLIAVRESLKTTDTNPNNKIAKVVTKINKELESEDTWELFKKMFDNVDKDFLMKIKSRHAELTPNDLKLCTYLRLNLSSKEIAPLLNISVRSMEMKRYRLRKKMNLPQGENLVNYILSI